jgi:hypothetical protein
MKILFYELRSAEYIAASVLLPNVSSWREL